MLNRVRGVGAMALLLAACGGDPTGTNAGDPLAEDEIQAFFDIMSEAFSDVGTGGTSAQVTGYQGPQLARVPVNADASVTAPCPAGGSIQVQGSVSGNIDDESFDSDLNMDLRWTYNACAFREDGVTFTVDGDPEVRFEADMVITNSTSTVALSGTQTGGFRYTSSDGRSGSCAIDISFTVNTTAQSATGSVTGTVCGVSATAIEAFGL